MSGGGVLGIWAGLRAPSLARELRKLLLWLTLACFSRTFDQKQINWTGRAGSFSIEMGVVQSKVGMAQNFRTPCFSLQHRWRNRGWGQGQGPWSPPPHFFKHSLLPYATLNLSVCTNLL